MQVNRDTEKEEYQQSPDQSPRVDGRRALGISYLDKPVWQGTRRAAVRPQSRFILMVPLKREHPSDCPYRVKGGASGLEEPPTLPISSLATFYIDRVTYIYVV